MAKRVRTLGKYRLLSELGKGGMGEVWKAYQPDLDRNVAVKVMVAGEHASGSSIERFKREAHLAAKLTHPGIVKVFDVGNEGSLHYIVMELVEGQSLDYILQAKKLTIGQALRTARSVAEALAAAHEQGVIHRDVKPGNILIDDEGGVRIADFGLAKHADQGSLTDAGALLGTPDYMAPEQAFGDPTEVTARADVYGLAAVLYEMLAGRPPHTGATPLAVLRKLEDEEPAPPSKHNPEVSRELDALLVHALAKDPERRLPSAKAFADALGALSSKKIAAESERVGSVRVRPPREPRRGASPAPLAAAIGVVLLGGAFFFVARRPPTPPPEDPPPPPHVVVVPRPPTPPPPPPAPVHVPDPLPPPPPPPAPPPDTEAPVDTQVPTVVETPPPPPAPTPPPPPAPDSLIEPAKGDGPTRAKKLIAEADGVREPAGRRAKLEAALELLPPGEVKLRADVQRKLGRFGRAAQELTPLGVKEAGGRWLVDRLAARPLRWASFGVREVFTKKELEDAESTLASPDQFFAAALVRIQGGGAPEAALEKVGAAAAASAPRREVAFLRAEAQLTRFARTRDTTALDAAQGEIDSVLDKQPTCYDLLAQKIVVVLETGDWNAAKALSDRLIEEAPATEAYLLRAHLYARAKKWSEAKDNLDTVKRLDSSIDLGAFQALCEANRILAGGGQEKFMGEDQKKLLDRVAKDDRPLAALVRAFVYAVRSSWKDVERELKKVGDGKAAFFDRPELRALAAGAGSPPLEIAAGRDILLALNKLPDATAATRLSLRRSSEIADGDRRKDFEKDGYRILAKLLVGKDYDGVLANLEEAINRGLTVDEVKQDDSFAPLRNTSGFELLLRKYSQ